MSYVPAGLDVRKLIATLNLLASEKDDRLEARSTAMLDPPKHRPRSSAGVRLTPKVLTSASA
jgi:hypothetical protein